MTGEVVSLTGKPVPVPGEPNAETVSELEKLLEAARAGEVLGGAIAFIHADGAVNCTYAGRNTFSMVGKLTQMTLWLADRATNLGVE
jgi:hypothetical protein